MTLGSDAAARLDEPGHVGRMLLLTSSPLTAAQIMLLLDRYLGAHFFDTQAGGSAVLWLHFFWIFGHPEVYVLIIPGFAIRVRDHSGLFAQDDFRLPVDGRRHRGHRASSAWACGRITCSPSACLRTGNTFFVLATMAVGVPTGIKIFNWLATMWGGKIRFDTPMLFCIGFPLPVSRSPA